MNKKQEVIEYAIKLFKEKKIVIPSSFPVEKMISYTPESDASLALKYALYNYLNSCLKVKKE